jgi:hypothetical protein
VWWDNFDRVGTPSHSSQIADFLWPVPAGYRPLVFVAGHAPNAPVLTASLAASAKEHPQQVPSVAGIVLEKEGNTFRSTVYCGIQISRHGYNRGCGTVYAVSVIQQFATNVRSQGLNSLVVKNRK